MTFNEVNLYNSMMILYTLTGIESNIGLILAIPSIILQILVFIDINNF